MNKQFNSYDDLLKEKQQLEILLQAQKQVIHYDIQELKLQLKPVKDAIEVIKKFTTKDKTSVLLNIGSDLAINTLLKNFILSRAGWFTKIVVPYFLKNYSSHFLAEQKEKWFDKLAAWISHRNGKEKKKEAEKKEEQGEEDIL
jgi:hypothetical protein